MSFFWRFPVSHNSTELTVPGAHPADGAASASSLSIGQIALGNGIVLRHMVASRAQARGTVLFLHGFPETMLTWQPLAEALASDYAVHAFDWPGYGQSSRPAVEQFPYAPADYARVLQDYVRVSGIDRSSLLIYATDIGALPALLAALDQPDLARHIVVGDFAPFNRPQYMFEGLQALKSAPSADVVRAGMNKTRDDVLANAFFRGQTAEQRFPVPQALFDDMAKGWDGDLTSADAFYHYYSHFTRDEDYFEASMARLAIPVTVTWGELDFYIKKEMGVELAMRNALPLHIFPQAGHYPHLQVPGQAIAQISAIFAAMSNA